MIFYIKNSPKGKTKGPYNIQQLCELKENGFINNNSTIHWGSDNNNYYSARIFFREDILRQFERSGEDNSYEDFSHNNYNDSFNEKPKETRINLKCRQCSSRQQEVLKININYIRCKKCGKICDITYDGTNIEILWDIELKTNERSHDIPMHISEALDFFNIKPITINKDILSKAYKEMILKYHPDKTASLAQEFQDLAHQKTAQINQLYDLLLSYFP